jgi:hypothetical protein
MTEPRDNRFSDPPPLPQVDPEFLPKLKPGSKGFVERLAEERGFKFVDKTKQG